LCPGALLVFLTGRSKNRLYFVAIDEASDIGIRNLGRREAKYNINTKMNEEVDSTYR